jgi:predicted SprT family Zn-dependent metalloprotease
MHPADAEQLARNLIREHLEAHPFMPHGPAFPYPWTFGFNSRRLAAGVCKFSKVRIELSRPWVLVNSETAVRMTVLHEIAHALAGPHHGHDSHWQRIAIALGDDGQRCTGDDTVAPPAPWVGTCSNGHVAKAYRKPSTRRLMSSCGRCSRTYSPAHQYTWRKV